MIAAELIFGAAIGWAQVKELRSGAAILVRTLALLEGAGLTSSLGNNVYALHPGLTRYLRVRAGSPTIGEAANRWREVFVNVMAAVADQPAVDPDVAAGDERRIVGAEERRQGRNVRRLPGKRSG